MVPYCVLHGRVTHPRFVTQVPCHNSAPFPITAHTYQNIRITHRKASEYRNSAFSRPSAASNNTSTTTAAATPQAATQPTTIWRVYRGRMPLVGFEKLAESFKSTPFGDMMQLHTYILLEGPDQVWCFDFLPMNPTSPVTAVTLLSAGAVPGDLRVRQLKMAAVKTNSNIQFIGSCQLPDPVAAAKFYNRSFNPQLHLITNSCQHHTDGLLKLLTQPSD